MKSHLGHVNFTGSSGHATLKQSLVDVMWIIHIKINTKWRLMTHKLMDEMYQSQFCWYTGQWQNAQHLRKVFTNRSSCMKNVRFLIEISAKFVYICPLHNIPRLVDIDSHRDTFCLCATLLRCDRRYLCTSTIKWNLALNSSLPSTKLHLRPPTAPVVILQCTGHSNIHSQYIV